jgi:hypothetical protein
MAKNRSSIPLCQSGFLQDVTIALGRRSLKSLRKLNSTLIFNVSQDAVNGVAIERLDIEARTLLGRMTKITLWEDGAAWVYCRERVMKASNHPRLDVHACLKGTDAVDIAQLLRITLADAPSAEAEWRGHTRPDVKALKRQV